MLGNAGGRDRLAGQFWHGVIEAGQRNGAKMNLRKQLRGEAQGAGRLD